MVTTLGKSFQSLLKVTLGEPLLTLPESLWSRLKEIFCVCGSRQEKNVQAELKRASFLRWFYVVFWALTQLFGP